MAQQWDEEPLTRRQVLRKGMKAGWWTLGATAGYSWLVEPRWIEVVRPVISIKNLPPSFEGLTIGVMADFHFGSWISPEEVQGACRTMMELKPDLIALPGDFIQRGWEHEIPTMEAGIRGLSAPLGVYAVFGNHDHYGPVRKLSKRLEGMGYRVLMNEAVHFVRDGGRLWLCGTDDLRYGVYLPQKALGGLPPDEPRIMLQHTPDAAEELDPLWRVDLAISGHMHGGQGWPMALIPGVVPSRYGIKFARGLVQGKGHRVYVTRGIGGQGPGRPRLFSRPEITFMTLVRGT